MVSYYQCDRSIPEVTVVRKYMIMMKIGIALAATNMFWVAVVIHYK